MSIIELGTHPAVMHCSCIVATIAVSAAMTAIGPHPLAAQSAPRGVITATIRDSTGAAVAGAEVVVTGTSARGYTDDDGAVRLSDLAAGRAHVTVRRLGFRATAADVQVASNGPTPVAITLQEVPQRLSPIMVRGTAQAYGNQMEGFYRRRSHGFGHFFTRTDIARARPDRLTDLFRTVPGIQLTSTRLISNALRMRGERDCPPLVWIDGAPAASAEFDLDAIVPNSVEAIEVYNGPSEVPVQFMPPLDVKACGVVVVWSRHGEPPERRPRNPLSPAEIADLVATLKVYTAEEVDVPAHQDTSVHVVPVYPESFFLSGKSGKVSAEFVVDTTGRVSMDTFNAVSSTDEAFTVSVRRALANARYVPALLNGQRVRQVVQQPFRFYVDSAMVTSGVSHAPPPPPRNSEPTDTAAQLR